MEEQKVRASLEMALTQATTFLQDILQVSQKWEVAGRDWTNVRSCC
jgi:hypothetical protein